MPSLRKKKAEDSESDNDQATSGKSAWFSKMKPSMRGLGNRNNKEDSDDDDEAESINQSTRRGSRRTRNVSRNDDQDDEASVTSSNQRKSSRQERRRRSSQSRASSLDLQSESKFPDTRPNKAQLHLTTNKELCIEIETEDVEKRPKGEPGNLSNTVPVVAAIPVYSTEHNYSVARSAGNNASAGLRKPGPSSAPNAQTGDKQEEIYVESLSTGKFKKIVYKLDNDGNRIVKNRSSRGQEVKEHSPKALRMLMIKVASLVDAFFLFCQGIFCGAAIFQLIVIYQINNAKDVVSIYGPLALEIRRAFFFLSVLSFVGACDKYNVEKSQEQQWFSRSQRERSELIIYVLFYFLSLLFTLLAGPVADDIGHVYSANWQLADDTWIDDYLQTSTFSIDDWRLYITLRVVFCSLGWILLSKDVHRDLFRGRERLNEIGMLEGKLKKVTEMTEYLSGNRLDNLRTEQLDQVFKIQQRGLNETTLQLKLRKPGLDV